MIYKVAATSRVLSTKQQRIDEQWLFFINSFRCAHFFRVKYHNVLFFMTLSVLHFHKENTTLAFFHLHPYWMFGRLVLVMYRERKVLGRDVRVRELIREFKIGYSSIYLWSKEFFFPASKFTRILLNYVKRWGDGFLNF